jgi:hypothetical protein
LPEPDFRSELDGIVNVESLIELFGQISDRGDLYAKVIRDRWLGLAQDELNANLDLAGVAPLSRNTLAAQAIACSRNSIVTAMRQLFASLATSVGMAPAGTSHLASRVTTPYAVEICIRGGVWESPFTARFRIGAGSLSRDGIYRVKSADR